VLRSRLLPFLYFAWPLTLPFSARIFPFRQQGVSFDTLFVHSEGAPGPLMIQNGFLSESAIFPHVA